MQVWPRSCRSRRRRQAARSGKTPRLPRQAHEALLRTPDRREPSHGQSAERFAEGYGASRSHIHTCPRRRRGGSEGIGLARPCLTSLLHTRLHTHRTRLNLQADVNTKAPTYGALAKPSDGLEPSTASFPSIFGALPSVARGCRSAYLRRAVWAIARTMERPRPCPRLCCTPRGSRRWNGWKRRLGRWLAAQVAITGLATSADVAAFMC